MEHNPPTTHRAAVLDTPGIETYEFRSAARRFASGVGVVAARWENRTLAKTVSSFTSVSLNPPLISVCIGSASPLVSAIHQSGCFAVSILQANQHRVSAALSAPGSGQAGTESLGIATTPSRSGAAVIDGYLSYFDCSIENSFQGGDHTIVIGRVIGADSTDGQPLLYFDGGYRSLHTLP
ncbi:flavin reductase family protein [Rhodococcus sp. NPDC059968]|uniref:flavin reductase family protein n=1 Tax=Rhodococcus sp. NPDC059968 TaxID=3347017 RepID=UPI00366B6A87